jgi:HSP20 family protein
MDDLWGGFGLAPVAFAPQAGLTPSFDAVELDNEYRVTADLPGVEPAELEVSVEDGVLTIKGHRHFEDEDENENEEGSVTRVEELGRFERRIRFPGEIVEDNVKASYKHGVLRVKIPKPEEIKPEVRSIPVETS